MFESLTERISSAFKKLGNRGLLKPEDIEAALREVRLALLEADVNYKVVKDFGDRVRTRAAGEEVLKSLSPAQTVVKIVNEELVELLGGTTDQPGLRYSPHPPTVVLLAGLQGSGKTTTTVKLALLARRDGHRPAVVALDLRRPAAVDQLRQLAEREKVAFLGGEGKVEDIARRSLEEAKRIGVDVVLLDTAGRLQVDAELMDELKALKKAVPVTETLLVADSMTGQEAVNVGAAFDAAIGIDGVILTKLDGDARGGAALSLRAATGKPVRFAGVGEKPADLEPFRADRMASRILGMGDVLTLIEKAQANIDQEAAAKIEKNLRTGRVSFDDMLLQMRQVRSMGSLESVVAMIPGAAQIKDQVAGPEAEREVKKMEAVITSMTPEERMHPERIDGSRRRRIAKGSGTQVSDVNRVLKSREQMEQLMKQFGGGKAGRGAFDIAKLTRRR